MKFLCGFFVKDSVFDNIVYLYNGYVATYNKYFLFNEELFNANYEIEKVIELIENKNDYPCITEQTAHEIISYFDYYKFYFEKQINPLNIILNGSQNYENLILLINNAINSKKSFIINTPLSYVYFEFLKVRGKIKEFPISNHFVSINKNILKINKKEHILNDEFIEKASQFINVFHNKNRYSAEEYELCFNNSFSYPFDPKNFEDHPDECEKITSIFNKISVSYLTYLLNKQQCS